MIDPDSLASLEVELNSFELHKRSSALEELLCQAERGAVPGVTQDVTPGEPAAEACNMHCHTFYSFNAYGHSPTSLAWLGKKQGIPWMGIVDFDVLDGVDEFLNAADQAGIKSSAGIETRVFLPEFATREINSPGEPGILYHMGIGFTTSKVPATAAPVLASLRQRAIQRNIAVVERVNAYLAPVSVDYEADVLPLTPAGTATERHIVVALIRAAERLAPNPAAFWADKLQITAQQAEALIEDSPKFQNQVRAKLMKRGGVGYIEPTPAMFPTVDELHSLILACQALPCAAWLDGTSEGEQALDELLDLLVGKGAVAFNIVPDRNWNIPDPQLREVKVRNLYAAVDLARQLDLPMNVGTEMNSFGQRWVDDFSAPELAPVRQDFIDGACFITGHTMLQRALRLGFQSEWARSCLPARKDRNRFYTQVGRLAPAGSAGLALLKTLDPEMLPADIILQLEESEGVR